MQERIFERKRRTYLLKAFAFLDFILYIIITADHADPIVIGFAERGVISSLKSYRNAALVTIQ